MPRKQAHANADAFLAAYRETASITEAAKAANISRALHYRWLQYPSYAKAFEQAKLEAADMLEDEAIRRVREGVLEPVFYQGAKCGAVRRYPEGLTQFLLRGLKPDRYGKSGVELTGPGGGPIETALTVTFVKPKK